MKTTKRVSRKRASLNNSTVNPKSLLSPRMELLISSKMKMFQNNGWKRTEGKRWYKSQKRQWLRRKKERSDLRPNLSSSNKSRWSPIKHISQKSSRGSHQDNTCRESCHADRGMMMKSNKSLKMTTCDLALSPICQPPTAESSAKTSPARGGIELQGIYTGPNLQDLSTRMWGGKSIRKLWLGVVWLEGEFLVWCGSSRSWKLMGFDTSMVCFGIPESSWWKDSWWCLTSLTSMAENWRNIVFLRARRKQSKSQSETSPPDLPNIWFNFSNSISQIRQ